MAMKKLILLLCLVFALGCATSRPTGSEEPWADGPVWGASYSRFRGAECAWCGSTNKVEWAHYLPQGKYPELRNDPRNGVTLCRNCHIVLGHFGDRACRVYNPDLPKIMTFTNRVPTR